MKEIRLLHIGDVHFPDTEKKYLGDLKDQGFRDEFCKEIRPHPIRSVSRAILSLFEDHTISAILLSGDLTSRGNLKGYSDCVDHFLDLVKSAGDDQGEKISVVLGNHDVVRPKEDKDITIDYRFGPFKKKWASAGLDILPVDNVRQSDINQSDNKAAVISINTCVGCGEFRRFPQELSNQIQLLLQSADLENSSTDFQKFGEALDTPAISQTTLEYLDRAIARLHMEDSLPVLLGHHSLLPQMNVRVEVYTELMNSGQTRAMLTRHGKPVIYCHGHIHDDPIEVIATPGKSGIGLVTISAPEFSDGFNLITIHYSSENKPIGLTVQPFRMRTGGYLDNLAPIRIPLTKQSNILDYCTEYSNELFKIISEESVRYKELYEKANSISDNSKITFENSLLELEWLGLLRIQNRDERSSYWQIRRLGL